MKTLLSKIKTISPAPFAIQLAHAGRKASCDTPWGNKKDNIILKNLTVGKHLVQVKFPSRFRESSSCTLYK